MPSFATLTSRLWEPSISGHLLPVRNTIRVGKKRKEKRGIPTGPYLVGRPHTLDLERLGDAVQPALERLAALHDVFDVEEAGEVIGE